MARTSAPPSHHGPTGRPQHPWPENTNASGFRSTLWIKPALEKPGFSQQSRSQPRCASHWFALALISLDTKDKFPLNSGKGEQGNFCDGDTAMLTHWDDHKQGWLQQHCSHSHSPRTSCPLPSTAPPWCHWPWGERGLPWARRHQFLSINP